MIFCLQKFCTTCPVPLLEVFVTTRPPKVKNHYPSISGHQFFISTSSFLHNFVIFFSSPSVLYQFCRLCTILSLFIHTFVNFVITRANCYRKVREQALILFSSASATSVHQQHQYIIGISASASTAH